MQKDNLKILEGINRVEVPASLYANIKQRIENELQNSVSTKTVYTMAASFLIFFFLNVYVATQYNSLRKEANTSETYGFNTNNNLYK